MSSFIEELKKELEQFMLREQRGEIGRVVKIADGIAEIEGLPKAMMGEMLLFDQSGGKSLDELLQGETQSIGMVLNLERDTLRAVVLGEGSHIEEGTVVRQTGNILSIPVSGALLGRVIDPLGNPLDGGAPIFAEKRNPLERRAYGVIERKSVDTPLQTGIKAIDGMIPIGRGQRELIIGDRQTGKTSIAIDTILNQKSEHKERRPICIYVAIGQKESKIARLVEKLREEGALEYSIIVSASASRSAALQFLAPYAGAAIGEYFMDEGKDALVVYDDLSKHAVAYRQLSLLLRRPPGREAYPGDIFYLHSRLLERAARLSEENGGGSLTALPIIETQENDVSAYIPTNVISITDGQIYLESDLFNKGIRPAINVGISVSRVGSAAQTKAMKKVAGKLRLELAQFRELEAFTQFSQDLDQETKKRIEKGRLMVEVLKQSNGHPMPLEHQVSILFLAVGGELHLLKPSLVQSFEKEFLSYLDRQYPEVLPAIRDGKELSKGMEKFLHEAIKNFQIDAPEFFFL